MRFSPDLASAVGNTPLIKLRRASEETGCTILGKAEFMNPGQSVKDRAALSMINHAVASGELRPGGTIAGPVMMGLADAAMYALVLSRIGPVELAMTTSLNINFLRKPAPGDVLAKATGLKFGKRLAIGEISLFSETSPEDLVAHATATYSIPPA